MASGVQKKRNMDHQSYIAELEKKSSVQFEVQFEVIQQMLNQLLQKHSSHGSNSNLFQKNQQAATINKSSIQTQSLEANHHTAAEFQEKQQQSHSPRSEATKQIPKFSHLDSKTLDLQPRLLNQKSEQIGEAKTSHINGGTQMAMTEVDADLSAQGGVEADAVLEEGGDSCNARNALTTFIRYPQGGGRGLHRSSSIAAKSPILMAAVFPWDRNREVQTKKSQDGATATDFLELTAEGVGGARKLPVEERAVSASNLPEKVKTVTQEGSKVVGSKALMKMDGSIVQVDPPWLPAREKNLRKTQEDDAVHVGIQQRKPLVEGQPQLFLLGLSWALEFHSIGLTFRAQRRERMYTYFG